MSGYSILLCVLPFFLRGKLGWGIDLSPFDVSQTIRGVGVGFKSDDIQDDLWDNVVVTEACVGDRTSPQRLHLYHDSSGC